MASKKWSDMSPAQQTATVVSGVVQASLAIAAWVDLARRDASEVNCSKAKWAAVIAINWVGPITNFVRGRRRVADS